MHETSGWHNKLRPIFGPFIIMSHAIMEISDWADVWPHGGIRKSGIEAYKKEKEEELANPDNSNRMYRINHTRSIHIRIAYKPSVKYWLAHV